MPFSLIPLTINQIFDSEGLFVTAGSSSIFFLNKSILTRFASDCDNAGISPPAWVFTNLWAIGPVKSAGKSEAPDKNDFMVAAATSGWVGWTLSGEASTLRS